MNSFEESFNYGDWMPARDLWFVSLRKPVPAISKVADTVKDQVVISLEGGFFEDVEFLRTYFDNPERIPLKKITIEKIDDDQDLIFLARFTEVEELILPIKNITNLGLRYLFALTSLRKVTFIAPPAQGYSKITEDGLLALKGQFPQAEVVFQHQT